MRVIAGTARGRPLAAVPGDGTRPITDRVKSALFSILGIGGADRGASLSRPVWRHRRRGHRGAEPRQRRVRSSVSVTGPPCARCQRNLEATGLAERGSVVPGDAFAYLERTRPIRPIDVVYIAPPQYQRLWLRALLAVDARPELLTEWRMGYRADLPQGMGASRS